MRKHKWLYGLFATVLLLSSFTGCGSIPNDVEYGANIPDEVETATVSQAEVKPVDDYYRYVNGATLADAEFKYGEEATAKAFDESIINDEVKDIVKEVVKGGDYEVGTEEYVLANAYKSFMNYDFKKAGVPKDLDKMFHEIDSVSSVKDLLMLDAKISKEYAVGNLLNIKVDENYLKAGQNVITFNQRSMIVDALFSMLDESYDCLNNLRDFTSKFMQALGHDEKDGNEIGTELAYITKDIYTKTDLKLVNDNKKYKSFQLYSAKQVKDIFSNVDIDKYLTEMGMDISYADSFGVYDPKQLEALNDILVDDNLEALKAWVIDDLGKEYEKFVFGGYPELKEYAAENYDTPEENAIQELASMYEVNDILYVEKYYTEETDTALRKLCEDIKQKYRELIKGAGWFSEETKAGLLKKLDNMVYVTGKNLKRHDPSYYADLTYDDYYKFHIEYSRLEHEQRLKSLAEPVDREEPQMIMHELNACYQPSHNNITITVAITNAPYFDSKADYYTNLGGLGMVIAHEMGHAFDSNCILFDENGVYNPDWISENDKKTLEERNKKMISYFEDNFTLFGIYHVDGEQTLGENYADLGAMECISSIPQTNEERKLMFENYARIWCQKVIDENLIETIATDEHSPAVIRVNGVLSTLDSFYKTYDVNENDGMYIAPDKRVSRWF